jgi:hypothetical protein
MTFEDWYKNFANYQGCLADIGFKAVAKQAWYAALRGVPMQNFDATIERFRSKELKVECWNFCTSKDGGKFDAYIMGEGAEQCLAYKKGFENEQEIIDLYKSLGVKRILPI